MSEIKQEQVQQIQKKKAAFDSVLRKFQMILFVELVLSLIFFLFEKRKKIQVCACNAMVKEYICFGEGTRLHGQRNCRIDARAPTWCPGFGRGNVHVIIFMAWH